MEILSVPAAPAVTDPSAFLSFRIQQIKTSDDFYQFCQENPDYKFEREADGRIIVMPNTGGRTGLRNSKLNLRIGIWNENAKLGEVSDSSTAFYLPDGSTRSRDVA